MIGAIIALVLVWRELYLVEAGSTTTFGSAIEIFFLAAAVLLSWVAVGLVLWQKFKKKEAEASKEKL